MRRVQGMQTDHLVIPHFNGRRRACKLTSVIGESRGVRASRLYGRQGPSTPYKAPLGG